MPDLLHSIESCLNTAAIRDNLKPLFCEVLLWGHPQGQTLRRDIRLDGDTKIEVGFVPVAQLGGLPVLRVDWPLNHLPTVTQRRAVHSALAAAHTEHLLAYVTQDGRQASLVWARQRPNQKVEMRALPYAVGSPARTTIEQIAELAFTIQELGLFGEPPFTEVADKLNAAFDVEAVTTRFFTTYRALFEAAEQRITGIAGDARRLFTQNLFNRLMFLVFVERKGWLTFNQRSDYLNALWQDYQHEHTREPDANFYRDRLRLLFFSGLNAPDEVNIVGIRSDGVLQTRIGKVPYLNGGLFEQDADDRNPAITVADDSISAALRDMFYRFNFTVTESTPLDVEVAVDPEMLGKVFEELVTGRHETGSYYTPKQVVAFMGREALKAYLRSACPHEAAGTLAAFVDDRHPDGLRDPEALLDALHWVRVCDPACGSGAYLVGMLHELLELRACLFAHRGVDAVTTYHRKLEIIQNNLYGVDKDRFAVNIARLRLWLSLVVDFEGDDPPPLPNLDFKIERGDSLTAPNPSGGLGTGFRTDVIAKFFSLKADYLDTHGSLKLTLRAEIERQRGEIAAWAGRQAGVDGFDWAVEFAEVFTPPATSTMRGAMAGIVNTVPGQMELAPKPLGGFDIILANPPYVRADAQFRHIEDEAQRQAAIAEWKAYRKRLKTSKSYDTLYEKWDLYIPFLERAYQLLRPGGQMVYIISDAYNAAKYADRSHQFFLKHSRVERIDFCSEIPLFRAGVNNTIVHFARTAPDCAHMPLRFQRWGHCPADFDTNIEALPSAIQSDLGMSFFRADGSRPTPTVTSLLPLEYAVYVSVGMVIHAEENKYQGEFGMDDVLSNTPTDIHTRRFVLGKDIVKWTTRKVRYLEWDTDRSPARFRRPTFQELHAAPEKLIAVRTPGHSPKVVVDDGALHFDASSVGFVPWHHLSGIVNRSLKKVAQYRWQSPSGDREERERTSRQFHPKYLLAIMNSAYAREWLARRRRSKLHIYPDDWKKLPIVPLSPQQQREFVDLVDAIVDLFAQHGYPLPPAAAQHLAALERDLDARVARLYQSELPSSEVEARTK